MLVVDSKYSFQLRSDLKVELFHLVFIVLTELDLVKSCDISYVTSGNYLFDPLNQSSPTILDIYSNQLVKIQAKVAMCVRACVLGLALHALSALTT